MTSRASFGAGPSAAALASTTDYCVPIAVHIVRQSDGTGGLSDSRLEQGMEDLNDAYVATGIGFYVLSVDYIDDDDYYFNIDTDAEIDALRGESRVSNAINAYFTPTVEDEDGGLCGKSSFTSNPVQGIVMDNGCMGTSSNPSTWPHEVGHYFDLYHTHETAFGDELVDGTNCTTAGDLLCDTPADPRLDTSGTGQNTNPFPTCDYFGTETDSNGDSYSPDTSLFMSYSDKECRTSFTTDSEAQVLDTLLNERPELLTRGCGPVPECEEPHVCNDVGECSAALDCGADVVFCNDPDGDATTAECDPTSPFDVGTTNVDVTCSDGRGRGGVHRAGRRLRGAVDRHAE